MSLRRARRMIAEAMWLSGTMGAMCSVWTVANRLAAPPATHSYYAMIMAMGPLATAYCLSSIRRATFINLLIGLVPISVLMLPSGNPPEIAAGTSLVVATIFLLRMILQQHDQLIDLLQVQHQMRDLAHTDPLTGLANRREFDMRLDEEIAKGDAANPFSIALLDLNGFKPINDQHGHAIGDGVLCELAERLRRACGNHAMVARQGGDEFAIYVPAGSILLKTSLADHVVAVRGRPLSHRRAVDRRRRGHRYRQLARPWRQRAQLLEVADRALYAAKAADREKTSSVEGIGRVT